MSGAQKPMGMSPELRRIAETARGGNNDPIPWVLHCSKALGFHKDIRGVRLEQEVGRLLHLLNPAWKRDFEPNDFSLAEKEDLF